MKWVFDLDGVITANPSFFKWWIFHLMKVDNNNEISILTARNPKRQDETEAELEWWGIDYHKIAFMPPELDRSFESQGRWKVNKIIELEPDIWVDNDIKVYERACNIPVRDLITKTNIISL